VRLLAISDLHVGYPENLAAFAQLGKHPQDWLILCGDVCETMDQLAFVLDIATRRFARVCWVPGNHELWTVGSRQLRGLTKYQAMVDICRTRGVDTPEDPFPVWNGPGGRHIVAPLFLLYDYSFRPQSVSLAGAVDWASESGVVCTDEFFLHSDPYPSRQAWCEARCTEAQIRLELAAREAPLILVNHFPLRRELARVPLYPRFTLWCGTTATQDWHTRYRASVVVTGHLHIPATHWIDGVRFEEVSFGYPEQRLRRPRHIDACLRQILPSDAPGAPRGVQHSYIADTDLKHHPSQKLSLHECMPAAMNAA
jgi:Calcineurin-like phosphoesterase